jgi:hypothetical protein
VSSGCGLGKHLGVSPKSFLVVQLHAEDIHKAWSAMLDRFFTFLVYCIVLRWACYPSPVRDIMLPAWWMGAFYT